MTCKIERYQHGDEGVPGSVKSMTFRCDHPAGCDASPSDSEIMAGGGLARMGWECVGGKHYCPEHRLTPLPDPGVAAIAEERDRQIRIEGFGPDRDDAYENGELAAAAACYATGSDEGWPWPKEWWKPSTDPRRNLEKAGALIAAEIDRIDRKERDTK